LRTSIVHFQLRNLVWATTSHDIYAIHQNCVMHTNVLTEQTSCVVDLSGQSHESVRQVHIATACAGHGLVAAGAPVRPFLLRIVTQVQQERPLSGHSLEQSHVQTFLNQGYATWKVVDGHEWL
jgi:hypothetical protein